MILIFYVDDIVVVYRSKDQHKIDEFKAKLRAKYEVRALGECSHFLGIRIVRDRVQRKLWLLQDSYIDKLQEKFNVNTTKKPKTPLPSKDLEPFTSTATKSQIHGYQQKVRSLNFLAVITRPDIAKASSKLSEFLTNPSPDHIVAADQALEYVVLTKYLAMEFDGKVTNKSIFLGLSDSAFVDDHHTRFSSYSYCFKLFGGVIDFKAIKGKTVTLSSTEAELLALTMAAKEYIRWLRFFAQIQFEIDDDTKVYCDNLQTIRLLKQETPKLKTALCHVDIHQSWLRQEVQAGRLNVEWIPTADIVADSFTKMLSTAKHTEFVRQLNLVDIKGKF